jgi:hypothetical protein
VEEWEEDRISVPKFIFADVEVRLSLFISIYLVFKKN